MGSQSPNEGSNPCPCEVKTWSLNHWIAREIQESHILNGFFIFEYLGWRELSMMGNRPFHSWATVSIIVFQRTEPIGHTLTHTNYVWGLYLSGLARLICLENPRDGRAWWAAVYGVTQSQTWLKQLSSSNSSKTEICKGRWQTKTSERREYCNLKAEFLWLWETSVSVL